VKLTLSAAMRARDVSRPRPEDLAEAETTDTKIAEARSTERKNDARTPAGNQAAGDQDAGSGGSSPVFS
jgi:hypothetical protein